MYINDYVNSLLAGKYNEYFFPPSSSRFRILSTETRVVAQKSHILRFDNMLSNIKYLFQTNTQKLYLYIEFSYPIKQ